MNAPTQRRALLLRLPLIGLVAFAVLMGLWGALQRVGWALPNVSITLAGIHGPLMIGGVLGTLISLERAVALTAFTNSKPPWSYLVPAVSGIGGVLLVVFGASVPARLLLTVGSAGLVFVLAMMLRRQLALYTVIMTLGAGSWLVGNSLWLSGQPVYQVVHLWIGFLVLTIVSERLELSRVTRLSARSYQLFMLAVGTYIVGVILTIIDLSAGVRVAGLGEVALAAWLLRYDIARQTMRRDGLTRFIAVCLLVGYIWLGIGGVLGIAFGAVYAGFQYDALLHSVLLGFVISMIFGHAPIIFPSLTGRAVHFSHFFYAYLVILHVSLILRVIGDITAWIPGRMWGGLINVATILVFLATTVYSNFLTVSPGKN